MSSWNFTHSVKSVKIYLNQLGISIYLESAAFFNNQKFKLDRGFIATEVAIRIDARMSHYLLKPPKPFNTMLETENQNVKYVEKRIHVLTYAFTPFHSIESFES